MTTLLRQVLERWALELWGCFIMLSYLSYLWTGHIFWKVCGAIAGLVLAAVLALCVALARQPRRPPPAPVRRAWLDDEGNLHWTDL